MADNHPEHLRVGLRTMRMESCRLTNIVTSRVHRVTPAVKLAYVATHVFLQHELASRMVLRVIFQVKYHLVEDN